MLHCFLKHLTTLRPVMSHGAFNTKYNRGSRNYGRQDHGNGEEGSSKGRHPPHLKGKEIGLYYAKRAKIKKEEEKKNPRPVCRLLIYKQCIF